MCRMQNTASNLVSYGVNSNWLSACLDMIVDPSVIMESHSENGLSPTIRFRTMEGGCERVGG